MHFKILYLSIKKTAIFLTADTRLPRNFPFVEIATERVSIYSTKYSMAMKSPLLPLAIVIIRLTASIDDLTVAMRHASINLADIVYIIWNLSDLDHFLLFL